MSLLLSNYDLKRVTFAQHPHCPEACFFSTHSLLPCMIRGSWYNTGPPFVPRPFQTKAHSGSDKATPVPYLSPQREAKGGSALRREAVAFHLPCLCWQC